MNSKDIVWIPVTERLPGYCQSVCFRFDWNGDWQYGAGCYDDGFCTDAGDMSSGPNAGVTDWFALDTD